MSYSIYIYILIPPPFQNIQYPPKTAAARPLRNPSLMLMHLRALAICTSGSLLRKPSHPRVQEPPWTKRPRLGFIDWLVQLCKTYSTQLSNLWIVSIFCCDRLLFFWWLYIYISLFLFLRPLQKKDDLKKFLDSMLQKSGKIRGLIRDLRENYKGSGLMDS